MARASERDVNDPSAASTRAPHRATIVDRSATGPARWASWPQVGTTTVRPAMARPSTSGSSSPAPCGPSARAQRSSTSTKPGSRRSTSLIRTTSLPIGVRRPRSARKFRTVPWRRARRASAVAQWTARSVSRRGVWASPMNSDAVAHTASASHRRCPSGGGKFRATATARIVRCSSPTNPGPARPACSSASARLTLTRDPLASWPRRRSWTRSTSDRPPASGGRPWRRTTLLVGDRPAVGPHGQRGAHDHDGHDPDDRVGHRVGDRPGITRRRRGRSGCRTGCGRRWTGWSPGSTRRWCAAPRASTRWARTCWR